MQSSRDAFDNDQSRPLVTLAVLAYNQRKYVRDAVSAALAQTYAPLEVLLSDDCSTDGTFDEMCVAVSNYSGPHSVLLNRNSVNLNIGGHINVIAARSSGRLLVLAAADDISEPNRVAALVEAWLRTGNGTAVLCSDFRAINESGAPTAIVGEQAYRGPFRIEDLARGRVGVLGATTAITRDVFTAFPPLSGNVRHEDRVLPFRALLLGGSIEFVPAQLVAYRVQGGISRPAEDSVAARICQLAERTLPDAEQRLADARWIFPDDPRIVRICRKALTQACALLEVSKATGWQLESSLLRSVFRGAVSISLLKQYARCRFRTLANNYYTFRRSRRV